MRRKYQPVRAALARVARSRGAPSAPAGAEGAIRDVGLSGVVGPLALAVDTAPAPTAPHPTGPERHVDRVERVERARRYREVAHGDVGHARGGEFGGLTAPAAPVYLVRDTSDADANAPAARRAARVAKRTIDVVCALIGLIVAAPVLAALALLVRLTSPGAAVFAQARVGRNGRMFRCYKLRTMRHDAESLLCSDPELRATYERNGFKIPCDADHRVTPIGRVLRLTSCDELPQLWNVLKGEMSLVGPRPLVVRELAHYSGAEREILLSVRPGLTGAWAVGGRSRVAYPRRAAMELDYVRRWTLWRDVVILFRTVGAVLARHGAD